MIYDVTDTALWVAAYRAQENARQDALFRDPFAQRLIGERGERIATSTQGSRYTAWSVVIRTCIIDAFIMDLLDRGIDTVLNLGAGLDTRPYRLNLSKNLRWIEVDFENILNLKDNLLETAHPQCCLERVTLDLSDINKRDLFFEKINSESKKVLIITEGVIPYLSNENAESLAKSLYRHNHFFYWVTEYYSPEILEFLRTPKRLKQMENAPFLFYPDHWFDFFKINGWSEEVTKYFGIESKKLGRTPPTPSWMKSHHLEAADKHDINPAHSFLGYTIYKRLE